MGSGLRFGPNSSGVEHFLGKEEVSGSIPDLGSTSTRFSLGTVALAPPYIFIPLHLCRFCSLRNFGSLLTLPNFRFAHFSVKATVPKVSLNIIGRNLTWTPNIAVSMSPEPKK